VSCRSVRPRLPSSKTVEPGKPSPGRRTRKKARKARFLRVSFRSPVAVSPVSAVVGCGLSPLFPQKPVHHPGKKRCFSFRHLKIIQLFSFWNICQILSNFLFLHFLIAGNKRKVLAKKLFFDRIFTGTFFADRCEYFFFY
jgi:hypothetical protein